MALSDAACRNAKSAPKLRKLSDGGGLQLWVQPSGARLWRLATGSAASRRCSPSAPTRRLLSPMRDKRAKSQASAGDRPRSIAGKEADRAAARYLPHHCGGICRQTQTRRPCGDDARQGELAARLRLLLSWKSPDHGDQAHRSSRCASEGRGSRPTRNGAASALDDRKCLPLCGRHRTRGKRSDHPVARRLIEQATP